MNHRVTRVPASIWWIVGALLSLMVPRSAYPLIGGQLAKDWTIDKVLSVKTFPSVEEKIFPSVVLLQMGCTGTVVGPRHILTAAHCVVMDDTNRRIKLELLPGNSLMFDTRAQWTVRDPYPLSWSHHVTIVRTLVHPSYLYASLNDNYPENTGDVAMLIVDRDIGTRQVDRRGLEANPPLLPIADIDFESFEASANRERLIKLGYGCDSLKAEGLLTTTNWNLKYDVFEGLPDQEEALKKAATYQKFQFRTVFKNFYWLSKAWSFDDTHAATNCPGDSGGALYRITRDGTKVVGVNSRSRLEHKENGEFKIWIDFHTRLDQKSSLRVDLWLKRALEYPKKEWFAGVAYLPIVPRSHEVEAANFTVRTALRDDLRVSSRLWLGYLDGIDGPCPLKFKSLEARGTLAAGPNPVRIALKNTKTPDRYGRFVLPESHGGGPVSVQEFTAAFERAAPTRDEARICYLSLYAME